jgi:hypothetical protein
MAHQIILYSNLDVSKIVMQENVLQDNTKKSIVKTYRILYQKDDHSEALPFAIQTPKMQTPFGISDNNEYANGAPLKYSLLTSFKGEEYNEKLKVFRSKINALEDRVIQLFLEQVDLKLLKLNDENRTVEFVRENKFYSSIKEGSEKDGKVFPDLFKSSISWDYETEKPRSYIEFYDSKREKQPYTELQKNADVILLVNVMAFFIANKTPMLGMTTKMRQAQFFNPQKLGGFQIKNEGSDDSEDEQSEEEDATDIIDEDDIDQMSE